MMKSRRHGAMCLNWTPVNTLAWLGALASTALFVIPMATNYWINSDATDFNTGLWERCSGGVCNDIDRHCNIGGSNLSLPQCNRWQAIYSLLAVACVFAGLSLIFQTLHNFLGSYEKMRWKRVANICSLLSWIPGLISMALFVKYKHDNNLPSYGWSFTLLCIAWPLMLGTWLLQFIRNDRHAVVKDRFGHRNVGAPYAAEAAPYGAAGYGQPVGARAPYVAEARV